MNSSYVLPRITGCTECEILTASCQCIICVDHFCTSCFTTLHKGSKSKHEWIYVIQPNHIPADVEISTYITNHVTLPSYNPESTTIPTHNSTSSSSLPISSSTSTSSTNNTTGVIPLPPQPRRYSNASSKCGGDNRSRRSSWQQKQIDDNEDIESFNLQTLGNYVRRASAQGNVPFVAMKQGSLKVLSMDEARNEVKKEYDPQHQYYEPPKAITASQNTIIETSTNEPTEMTTIPVNTNIINQSTSHSVSNSRKSSINQILVPAE